MTSGLFGGSDVSGIESQIAALTPQFQQYAGDAAALAPGFEALSGQATALEPNFLNLASTFGTEGGNIYDPALSQYLAGAGGTITAPQQAAVNQTLQQEQLQNAGTYGNLGLGGSTMQTQDANANVQKSLAQTQQFSNMDELAGLSGLSQALGYQNAGEAATTGALNTLSTGSNILGGATNAYGTAGSILSGATGALSNAGQLAAGQQQTQLGLLQSAGNALGGKGGGSSAGSSIF